MIFQMEISDSQSGAVRILSPAGRLDTETSNTLQERWLELIDKGDRWFVLDAADLAYVSSSGLRVILVAAKRLKEVSGGIVICGLNPRLQQVFDMTGFTSMFPIHSTREEAVPVAQALACGDNS